MKAEVKTILGAEKYLMNITAGNNSIIGDEPFDKGGQEKGFNPVELLASALSSCTAATVKMFADRKEWDLKEVSVKVLFDNDDKEKGVQMKKIITLEGNLTDEQREILHKAAHACPIQKILTGEVNVSSELG